MTSQCNAYDITMQPTTYQPMVRNILTRLSSFAIAPVRPPATKHNPPFRHLALSCPFVRPRVQRKQGAIILGIGGDNSKSAHGVFYEGVMTSSYSSDATDNAS